MLMEFNENHPISFVRPRTTKQQRGKFHAAHPFRHQPRCQIDKSGILPDFLAKIQTRLICPENYRCSEPDKAFLDSILPDHLK